MKSKLLLVLFFAVVIVYIVIMHNGGYKNITNEIRFNPKLSNYGLFRGKMSLLEPAAGVEVLDISSPLFTDYAEKQRLIKLPKGKRMHAAGNGLPQFPEGTIIAKTFYYSHTQNNKRRLIETRLLILKNGLWNGATYQWNPSQQEAVLIDKGASVPISFTSEDGKSRSITYRIPSQQDCGSCHRAANQLIPIGPKTRNLNIDVIRDGKTENQLVYLHEKGLLDYDKAGKFGEIPNYRNLSLPVAQRARAYFAMNCAHCHQPSGMAGRLSLDLAYETDYEHTGIKFNKQNILERIATMGEYHMPKMGTTIIDDEGVALIKRYIKSLPAN